jgi:tungstate transport system permease protein
VVGLLVLFAVSNQGPLGALELIFTREAMIMSQFVLATPPITAILAGFGRAISEVGSVLVVGGEVTSADGVSKTRTLTTAIQLEARQGQYDTAMVLGAVLLALVLTVNAIVVRLGDEGAMR